MISVIIPTLNEAETIGRALDQFQDLEDIEVIVCDGGSTDGTPDIVRSRCFKLIQCPKGRSLQMNLGAHQATGDILLFLHADSILPLGWRFHVGKTLEIPEVVAGAFSLRIADARYSLRIVEWLANFRSRRLGMPYGDQSLFLRKSTFVGLGGFPNIPIMEDFQFMRLLAKNGKVETAPECVTTSARRWLKVGPLKTTLINQFIIMGFFLGIEPKTLRRIYDRARIF